MAYITDTSTPASKVIHLDSKHAHIFHQKDVDGNELTSHFMYHMNEAVLCPEHLSMICSLHTATIPYSFYNVRHNVNNTIILNYVDNEGSQSGIYKVVLPSGNYTALSLQNSFLEVLLATPAFLASPWATNQFRFYKLGLNGKFAVHLINPFLSSTVPYRLTMTFDLTRLRYKFSNSSSVLSGLTFYWNTQTSDGKSTANDLFGFRDDVNIFVPYSSTGFLHVSSDKVIDMNDEIHGLYLRTSLTTDGTLNAETGIFSNILSRIPVTCNAGGVIFHTPNNSSHKLQISLPVIKFITIKLTDEMNRVLDLNGLNFQISIQIDFVRRLQTLNGITRHQRRLGDQRLSEYQNKIAPKKKKKNKKK